MKIKKCIIIDNASTDGSQEIIKQFKNINISFKKEKSWLWINSYGRIKFSYSDYLYVHNSDLEYDPLNAIEMLIIAESENIDVVLG